jgi:hypothetical protein
VSAAAGRSAAGASSQTSSSSASRSVTRGRAPPRAAARGRAGARCTRRALLRVPHHGPVAGAERLEVEPAELFQRLQVAGERTAPGRDEDAALAEHGVAAEEQPAVEEGDVVGGVAGRLVHAKGPISSPSRSSRSIGRPVVTGSEKPSGSGAWGPANAGTPNCSTSAGTASAWSAWRCVRTIPANPPRCWIANSSRSRWSGCRGAGVDQPRGRAGQPRVRARKRERPGFGAITRVTSWGSSPRAGRRVRHVRIHIVKAS